MQSVRRPSEPSPLCAVTLGDYTLNLAGIGHETRRLSPSLLDCHEHPGDVGDEGGHVVGQLRRADGVGVRDYRLRPKTRDERVHQRIELADQYSTHVRETLKPRRRIR